MRNLLKLNFKTAYKDKSILIINFFLVPFLLLIGTLIILIVSHTNSARDIVIYYGSMSPILIILAAIITSSYIFKMPQNEGLTYVLYSKPVSRTELFWSSFVSAFLINVINATINALFLAIVISFAALGLSDDLKGTKFIGNIWLLHIAFIFEALIIGTFVISFISIIFSKVSSKVLLGITVPVFMATPALFNIIKIFSTREEYHQISKISKAENLKANFDSKAENEINKKFVINDYVTSSSNLFKHNFSVVNLSNGLNMNFWSMNFYNDFILDDPKSSRSIPFMGDGVHNQYFYKKDMESVLNNYDYVSNGNQKIYIIDYDLNTTDWLNPYQKQKTLEQKITYMARKKHIIKWNDEYTDNVYPFEKEAQILKANPDVFSQKLFDDLVRVIENLKTDFKTEIVNAKANFDGKNSTKTLKTYETLINFATQRLYNGMVPLIYRSTIFLSANEDPSEAENEEREFRNFVEDNLTFDKKEELFKKTRYLNFDYKSIAEKLFFTILVENNLYSIADEMSKVIMNDYRKTLKINQNKEFFDSRPKEIFGSLLINKDLLKENNIDLKFYKVQKVNIFPSYMQIIIYFLMATPLAIGGWFIYKKTNFLK